MQLFKQRAQFDKLKYKLLARERNTPDKSKNAPSFYNVCPFCTKAAPRRRDTNTKHRSGLKKRNPPQSPFCQCSQLIKDSSKLTCAVCNVSCRNSAHGVARSQQLFLPLSEFRECSGS